MTGGRYPNLRLRRARMARHETQARVAEGIGVLLGHPVEAEYIGRLERGMLTWPHAHHRAALRAYFGVASEEELGFYSRRSHPAPPWEDDDEMKRRVVLGALPLAGLAISGPLAPLADAALADAATPPRRVGADHVTQIRALVAHAHEMDLHFGGLGVHEMLGAQVRWAVGLLDAHVDPAARDDLCSAVGQLAKCAAWSSHDVGVDAAAHRYYQLALRCAEHAGDWWLRASALAGLAEVVEYSGDGDTALTLAQQALVRPDRLTPLEQIGITTVEARAYGRCGDVQACHVAIGRTEAHFAAASPASESPAIVAFYSPAMIADQTGRAGWLLALHGHAVADTTHRLRTAADTHQPGYTRARTGCLARLATLQFAQGDPDEAVAVANTCLDVAGTVRSRRITDDLTRLRDATTQHHQVPGVADLQQRLNHALASTEVV